MHALVDVPSPAAGEGMIATQQMMSGEGYTDTLHPSPVKPC